MEPQAQPAPSPELSLSPSGAVADPTMATEMASVAVAEKRAQSASSDAASDAEGGAEEEDDEAPRFGWKLNVLMFVLTVISVLYTGAGYTRDWLVEQHLPSSGNIVSLGWTFAVPLMAILLTHEFGHYFAARLHRVPASLPFFIPCPGLSPFGTMGAVISMRGRIRSRDALLDIGASGPLCGIIVAIPVLWYGLAHSPVIALPPTGYVLEGQSLLYTFMKWAIVGRIPPGHDISMHPMTFAGWTGLLVTALNLLPVGQLDGGHIAYALFDKRQHRYARWFHRSLLLVFGYNLSRFVLPLLERHELGGIGVAISNSMFWLLWFCILLGLGRLGGKDHPPTDPSELSPARKAVAIGCLVLFALLFMPTPWAVF